MGGCRNPELGGLASHELAPGGDGFVGHGVRGLAQGDGDPEALLCGNGLHQVAEQGLHRLGPMHFLRGRQHDGPTVQPAYAWLAKVRLRALDEIVTDVRRVAWGHGSAHAAGAQRFRSLPPEDGHGEPR